MKKPIPSHKKPFLLNLARLFETFTVENKDLYYHELFMILHEFVKFSNASLLYFNPDQNKLEHIYSYGETVELIKAVEFEFGKGLSAWLAKEQKYILLNNLGKNDLLKNTKSFLSIPLILENNLYGMINFGSKKENAFSKKSLHYLHVTAPFIAAMLSQNKHIERLQAKNEEIAAINKTLNKTQNQLLELQKKETLSATVCSLNHEINNPLMIISGNIQLLPTSDLDEDTKSKLNSIEQQVERISDIVAQLRELDSPQFEKYIKDSSYDKILKLKSKPIKNKEN
jgi:signal transduction histidine kinase